jgi:hypothetical protein
MSVAIPPARLTGLAIRTGKVIHPSTPGCWGQEVGAGAGVTILVSTSIWVRKPSRDRQNDACHISKNCLFFIELRIREKPMNTIDVL